MGDLIRQYWIPVTLIEELAKPDAPPMRMRLLGEDLILFRDSSGRVGLLEDHCSHRGASLFFGRNEENGLRCVYHGWKYDVEGNCVDMPNEPPETSFAEKIHHRSYPCVEYGGMIWTYMGPRSKPPELPKLEWALLPPERSSVSAEFIRECNWMQALEGDIDTSHLYFLHARLNPEGERAGGDGTYHEDRHPRLHIVDTPYGVVYGSERDEGPHDYYWRITQFLFPFHTFIPPGGREGLSGHIWVPLDDTHTMRWSVAWDPIAPLAQPARAAPGDFLPATSDPLSRWLRQENRDNDYMIDREVQRIKTFTGIPSIPLQDQAVTESMGAITDRTHEHLGTSDGMIARVRRRLIDSAKALRDDGVTPPGVDDPDVWAVRSASIILPRTVDWREGTREHLKAFTELAVATV
jgi:phenylpropionate dioxygenase-like ring-hydroxylating dioxygenase large terminal subunit